MNNETNIDVKYVSPLKKLCMTIGELPSSYLETMSYYEMLVWFTEFLKNTVIPTINNNAEAVKELQSLYEELRTYVNDYFDNLDVQDEINNKLDEMAESGQLTDIIAQYLGLAGMITFDSVAEMKLAENLVNGSKCRTLGFHSVNDGGGAYYKIRTVTNDDVVDDKFIIEVYDNLLVAELIYDDINVKKIGAYGDNSHDDTSYLQTALDYANLKNKAVIIPNGVYVTDGLTSSSVILKGINATLKAKSGTDDYMLEVTGKPIISGITFDGDNKINGLIHINGLSCELTDLILKNSIDYSIDNTMSGLTNELAHIENSTFIDCGGGINLSGTPFEDPDDYKGRVEFINCKTSGNTGTGDYKRLYYFTKLNYVYVNGGEFTGNATYGSTNIYQVNHGEIIGGYYHDIVRGVTLGQITKNCIISNTINENLTGGAGLHIDLVTEDRVHPVSHSIISNNLVKNAYRGMYVQGKNIVLNNNYVYCGTNTASSGGIIRFNDNEDNTSKSNVTLDNLFVYNIGSIEDVIHCNTSIINLGKIYIDGSSVDHASFKSSNLCYKLNVSPISSASYYVKLDDEVLTINASATTNIYLPSTSDSKLAGRKIIIIRTDDTASSVRLRCRNDSGTINGTTSAVDGARIYKGVNVIIQTGVGEYWTITPTTA